MHSPPVRTTIFQYLMEATQQEGLTESCLEMRANQAIKAFSREKLAMAASTVRNTELMYSHKEGI